MGIPTKLGYKHAFDFYPKCDVLINKISESFNSTILQSQGQTNTYNVSGLKII